MDVGAFGRLDHQGINGVFVHSRDVFRQCPLEQANILRQVADIAPQRVVVILVQRGATQTQRAADRWPNAGERTGQRGLARSGRAQHGQHLSRLDLETDTLDQGALEAGSGHDDVFGLDIGLRARQARHRGFGRQFRQELAQFEPTLPGALHQLGLPDGLLDRGKSPPQQDRGGNHRPGRQLSAQDQPSTEREHGGLKEHAQRLGQGTENAGAVREGHLRGQRPVAQRAPASTGRGLHAERDDDIGLAGDAAREAVAFPGCLIGFGFQLPRRTLVEHGQDDQQHTACQGEPAQQRMERPDQQDVDRRPRHVEKGKDGR